MSMDRHRIQAIDNPAYTLTIAVVAHPAEHANNFHPDAPRGAPSTALDFF